jgi:hypothetical protein
MVGRGEKATRRLAAAALTDRNGIRLPYVGSLEHDFFPI